MFHHTLGLFLSCNFIRKEIPAGVFHVNFARFLATPFFVEHFWMTASVLQQLLALYLAIIYSWQLLTYFENLNSISNIFRETHYFLVLKDPLIICIYLFKNRRRTFWWPGERPSSHLKVTKMCFGRNINTFQNPSLRIFAAGKASLVYIEVKKVVYLLFLASFFSLSSGGCIPV